MKAIWPRFEEDEIRAAVRVLRSGRVNQWTGDEVKRFEVEFARFVGAEYAVAFANGSLALEAAYACAATPERRDIIVPARSFVATAMAAKRAGYDVIFADVGRDGNSRFSDYKAKVGPMDAAIGIVHLGGKPADVPAIRFLHRPIVEDCAQALGATIKGRHVGTFGSVGVFSFCQDKIMTTGGEGGMCVTSDYFLYRALWSWKDHGKNFEEGHRRGAGEYRYIHNSYGTNARMTEMQAAIGRVQLKKVRGWVDRRRLFVDTLARELQDLAGLEAPLVGDGDSCYRYYATLDLDKLTERSSRTSVLRALRADGIDVGTGACPELYKEQAFPWRESHHCGMARWLGERTLCFSVSHYMTRKDAERIARRVRQVVAEATHVRSRRHSG